MTDEYPLHDATFDGIILSDEDATLYFTTTSGTVSKVTLHEIDALMMDDFRNGNIVVFFGETRDEWPSSHIDLQRLHTPPHPSATEKYHVQHRAHLESKLASIANGNLSLIQMEPVIGATMLATSRRASLVQG